MPQVGEMSPDLVRSPGLDLDQEVRSIRAGIQHPDVGDGAASLDGRGDRKGRLPDSSGHECVIGLAHLVIAKPGAHHVERFPRACQEEAARGVAVQPVDCPQFRAVELLSKAAFRAVVTVRKVPCPLVRYDVVVVFEQ